MGSKTEGAAGNWKNLAGKEIGFRFDRATR